MYCCCSHLLHMALLLQSMEPNPAQTRCQPMAFEWVTTAGLQLTQIQEQQGLHEPHAWRLSASTAQACLVAKARLCHSCVNRSLHTGCPTPACACQRCFQAFKCPCQLDGIQHQLISGSGQSNKVWPLSCLPPQARNPPKAVSYLPRCTSRCSCLPSPSHSCNFACTDGQALAT